MHEYHGWFSIAETLEEDGGGALDEGLGELRMRLADVKWANGRADVLRLNGEHFLVLDGLVNHFGWEASNIQELLEFVAMRFPGSYGLLYERADEMPMPPGPNAFRVRRMARGRIDHCTDELLSPIRPVVED